MKGQISKIITMDLIVFLPGIVILLIIILQVYWMIKILSLIKESRIIHSMTLKTILKYCENKGVEIDIQKIQKEVEESVG